MHGERALVFDINAAIVDDVIGGMMYGKDNDGASDDHGVEQKEVGSIETDLTVVAKKHEQKCRSAKRMVLRLFAQGDVGADADTDGEKLDVYITTIAKSIVKLVNLCVKYMSCGTTFCMPRKIMSSTNDVIPTLFLRFCDEELVSRYIWVVAAVNLQQISDTLRRTWAFSIVMESATN